VPPRSLHFDHLYLESGWHHDHVVQIKGGLITHITPSSSDQSPTPPEKIKGWALPGLPNLHSHCFQRGMAGLSERRGPSGDSFWTWRDVMYRFLDRLDPDAVEDIAAMAMLEMMETGFTSLAEFHYLHHDRDGTPYANRAEMAERIIAAAHKTGLCLTLLPVFYAHSNFGGQEPHHGQRRFVNSTDHYKKLFADTQKALTRLAGSTIGLAPHSLRAATPQELSDLLTLQKKGPVHIHIAEQMKEVEDCINWCGTRPVDWLLTNQPVDDTWCLIHATHMNDQETRALAQSGAVAGLCPITEANLGDGLFPAGAFLEAGGRLGVGSDSNIEIAAAHELRWLEYGQRLTQRGRNLLAAAEGHSTGETLYRMACTSGAQALGQPVGSIAIGKRADFVVLNDNHPTLAGQAEQTILDAYLFAAGPAAIDRVITGGVIYVEHGRHAQHEPITQAYRERMKKILS
jgi:formimidoylglutamate deiminase